MENSSETMSTSSSFCKRKVPCYQADRQGPAGDLETAELSSLTHLHGRGVIQEAQGFFDGIDMLPRPGDKSR